MGSVFLPNDPVFLLEASALGPLLYQPSGLFEMNKEALYFNLGGLTTGLNYTHRHLLSMVLLLSFIL